MSFCIGDFSPAVIDSSDPLYEAVRKHMLELMVELCLLRFHEAWSEQFEHWILAEIDADQSQANSSTVKAKLKSLRLLVEATNGVWVNINYRPELKEQFDEMPNFVFLGRNLWKTIK